MNERIEAKKGKNSLFAHTHTQSPFSLLFSLLFLFVTPIYFYHYFFTCLDILEFWFYKIFSLSRPLSFFFFSFPQIQTYRYINNCDRLAYTGRNMSLNQVPSFFTVSLEKHHVVSLVFNIHSYYLLSPSPPSPVL